MAGYSPIGKMDKIYKLIDDTIDTLINDNVCCSLYYDAPKRSLMTVYRGTKQIVFCSDDETADLLIETVKNQLYTHKELYVQRKDVQEPAPFKLNINKIYASGSATLSKTSVHSSKLISVADVLDKLNDVEIQLTRDEKCEIEAILEDMSYDELLVIRRFSGYSHRINYYSPVDNRRKQTSLGDILVIIGDNVQLRHAAERKTRSDKDTSAALFYLPTMGHFYKKQ